MNERLKEAIYWRDNILIATDEVTQKRAQRRIEQIIKADTQGTDLVSLDPDTNTDLSNPQEKGRTPKP